MPGRNERHIVKGPGSGWDVKKPGQNKPVSHHRTQSAAEKAAKRDLAQDGGGESIVHRPDGRIRDSDSVSPGNDPFPPRDRK
jgi:hypothetical protein